MRAIVIGKTGVIGSAITTLIESRGGHVYDLPRFDIGETSEVFNCLAGLNVDVMINAAGSYGKIGEGVDPYQFARTVRTTLIGPYNAFYACRDSLFRNRGFMINFAGGGKGPLPTLAAYAASKSGLVRLTETLATENPKIKINCISPGPIYSKMQENLLQNPDCPFYNDIKRLKEGTGDSVPVENTVRLVDWLIFGQGGNTTGQHLYARTHESAQEYPESYRLSEGMEEYPEYDRGLRHGSVDHAKHEQSTPIETLYIP